MIAQLLTRLRERDIRLWLEGDRLRYSAPPGALTDELRALVSANRDALIAFLRDASTAASAPTLRANPTHAPTPLSFAQQRLWFVDRLDPGHPLYNIVFAATLVGPLDAAALQLALATLVQRHGALRTIFAQTDRGAVQIVQPTAADSFIWIDLSERSDTDAALQHLLDAEATHAFNLERGPLLRVTLARNAPERHTLIVVLHHIISDGWSQELFFRELALIYRTAHTGTTPDLPPLPIAYTDYVLWQREWLRPQLLAPQLAYWQQQFSSGVQVLDLPVGRARPATQSFRGACHYFMIDTKLLTQLRECARRHGATLFMNVLAAFMALLHRYTGQQRIVVGSPIAGRTRPELEGLIGCFINMLAIPGDCSGNPSFSELLNRVRSAALNAFANQDVPFERLVEALHHERSLSYHPIFQVMFALQRNPLEQLALPDVRLTPLRVDNGSAKVDLSLLIDETDTHLEATLEYSLDLFEPATIERMAGHFQTLLAGIAHNPELPLAHVPLLSEPEMVQVVHTWNATTRPFPHEATIQTLFEWQAARAPEAVALQFGETRMRYAELNMRANRLAYHLRGLGIGPDTLVALCAERSLEQIVGVLAILKAGGAYVPLDPSYPAERLTFMLDDTHATVLLAQSHLLERLPPHQAHVVLLDRNDPQIDAQPETNPPLTTGPEHLAYVIYTSGSTGRPKGVCVPHLGVTRLVCNTDFAEFGAQDVFLQLAPISFDASTLEIWGPLLNGGCLAIMPPHNPTLAEIAEALRRYRVTTLWLTAGLFHVMVEEQLDSLAGVRNLLAGGDVLSPTHVQAVLRAGGQVINGYGPTENTTFTTCYRVERADQIGSSVPIGRPIARTTTYILDAFMQPVPIGVPGELYTGGDGLARGYLARPELTAERFVPNPFDPHGGRLYRTGDLARWREDGVLEFLGRLDQQVKIRGFRIELGEIEAALLEHPQIASAVVVARAGGRNQADKRLVAYIVLETANGNAASQIAANELRAYLQLHLPDYMVPSLFVPMERLPLNPNGKVDRQALPAPEGTETRRREAPVAPRTPAETLLARIWADVLRIPQIGVHDNFFELGGDSILSIQIVARAIQAGLKLSPRQIFQYQTVAELAAVAETAPIPAAEAAPITGAAPLTPVQRWFFEHNFPEPHHWNQAMLLERRATDATLLERALRAVVLHHDTLRLRYTRSPDGWRQVYGDHAASLIWSRINLHEVPDTLLSATIEAQAAHMQAELDLTHGPLVRACLFECGSRPARLLIAIHHLVVDGVSWRIVLEDLATACDQLARGEAIALPLQSASFGVWATRLAAFARTNPPRHELDYWRATRQPAGQVPRELDGSNDEAATRTVSVALDEADTRALLQEVPSVYRTRINDVLLTAFAQTMSAWTEQPRVLLDLEGHGREELFEGVDLSRTVGWFTTIYPVLLELMPGLEPGAALKSVKEQLRHIPNQGIGYGLLRYLSDDPAIIGELRALPQPEIAFNYLGQFDQIFSGLANFGPAAESPGPLHHSRAQRTHLLEVISSVIGGTLRVDWHFSAGIHRPITIERLAQQFIGNLRAVIDHCREPEAGGYTPSDFPLARLDQATIDRLVGSDRRVEDIYPLAPYQLEMLEQGRRYRGSGVYVVRWIQTLVGPLEMRFMRRAWQYLIDRHPALRTTFVQQGLAEPIQIVRRQAQAAWEFLDWRTQTPEQQRDQLETLLDEAGTRGFEPEAAPPVRAVLIQLADEEHRLILIYHHTLLDGWSLPRLLNEWLTVYEAIVDGLDLRQPGNVQAPYTSYERRQRKTAPLGPPLQMEPVRPFREYIAWMQRQDLAAAQRYWRNAGVASASLPPARGLPSYAEQWRTLPETTSSTLVALAPTLRITPGTLAQGAWVLTLARRTGAERVTFGVTVSGRPPGLPGVEQMIGLLLNTLPLQVAVEPAIPLSVWLQALQNSMSDMLQHDFVAPAQIRAWNQLPPDAPLFESFFRFQNYAAGTTHRDQVAGVQVRDSAALDWWHHPLGALVEPGRHWRIGLIYRRNQVSDAEAQRRIELFADLLEQIAAGEEHTVGWYIRHEP